MKYFLPPFDKKSIEAQYKVLAKRFHPDKPGGSEKIMQEINGEKNLVLAWSAMPVNKLPPPERKTKEVLIVKARPRKIIRRNDTSLRLVFDNLKTLKSFIREIRKL